MRAQLPTLLCTLLVLATGPSLRAADQLQTFDGCTFEPTEWADGDSFSVRFPDGETRTVRLYGADCIEKRISDASDERRVRAQRRYFGIANFGGSFESSVTKAKQLGAQASAEVRTLLAEPFTVTTTFADARGDARFQRVYGFVKTSKNKDLAEHLVSNGLARAYGVYRRQSPSINADEYRQRLTDLELKAAKTAVGVWEFTDWDALPIERLEERSEEAQLAIAKQGPILPPKHVDPNTASRDLLMELPGIGETLANRIIECREQGTYAEPEDLRRVSGIGEKTIEGFREILKFGE